MEDVDSATTAGSFTAFDEAVRAPSSFICISSPHLQFCYAKRRLQGLSVLSSQQPSRPFIPSEANETRDIYLSFTPAPTIISAFCYCFLVIPNPVFVVMLNM